MHVAQLWRFPVKSLGGEQVDTATVGASGIVGDRQWGIVDQDTGNVLTGRRVPELLMASAQLVENGDGLAVEIRLPDGDIARTDDDLTAWLGRPVRLERASPEFRGTYETVLDFEHEDTSAWIAWEGPAGSFHDSARTQVSILSLDTIGAWPVRRFRANVVVDGGGEDDLVGHTVGAGTVVAQVVKQIDRCVMTTRPQPGLPRDLDVLRTINRDRDGNLGVGALVERPGTITVGDSITVLHRTLHP